MAVGDPKGRRRIQTRDATESGRSERLIAAMRRDRGYLYPEWERLAREAPEFVTAYNEIYRQALAVDARLPVKYRELVALGILAFRGESPGLVNHIRRALERGATRDEVLGAIEAMIIPGGALTFLNGLRALAKVDADRAAKPRKKTSRERRPPKAEGRPTVRTPEASRPDGESRDGDL